MLLDEKEIRKAVIDNEMTISSLADKLGWDRRKLASQMKSGTTKDADKIAKALGIESGDILKDEV